MGFGGKGKIADNGIAAVKGVKDGVDTLKTASSVRKGQSVIVPAASTVATLVASALSGIIASGTAQDQGGTMATPPGSTESGLSVIPPSSASAIAPPEPGIVRDEL